VYGDRFANVNIQDRVLELRVEEKVDLDHMDRSA